MLDGSYVIMCFEIGGDGGDDYWNYFWWYFVDECGE